MKPKTIKENFRIGMRSIVEHPQLISTIAIAAVIFGLFLFTADRFARIALDAQERLVNVRIGSIQDAFVAFVPERIDSDIEAVHRAVNSVVSQNETILDFRVLRTRGTRGWEVVSSVDLSEIGTTRLSASEEFLIGLAVSDPFNSFTREGSLGGDRVFQTARAFRDARGTVQGVVMTTQTLSEADRQINQNINNSFAILLTILLLLFLLFFRHARIVDYTALYKKLKEVDTLKDDFISMISHELRTPLASIRGYAELLSEGGELSDTAREQARRIMVSSAQLDRLVEDMLDVSRIERGQLKLSLKVADPVPIIADVVETLMPSAQKKNLLLILGRGESAPIFIDESRLRQVLVNLIGNAIKYTVEGEVKVTTHLESGKLFIRVSDTGIGLSSGEREQIFQKFVRIQNKNTSRVRGTGLGLWISAALVRLMKGTISVESIRNVGSHFVLSFPVVEQKASHEGESKQETKEK